MLGLPSETEDDLLGIVDLSAKVAAAGKFRAQITASVSNFVPKPHTPFQWAPQIPIVEVEARQELLRRELRRWRVKFRWHDARLSYLEGIFSRGDRRAGALLLAAFRLGCRFDGWTDVCRFDLWQQALRDSELSADAYLRRRMLDETLPWDHLGSGVTKSFLQRELAQAFARTLTPDCSVERCTYCGACDFTTIRNIDYHLGGAKGSEHRGAAVDHWASDIVADAEPGAWEPRGWQKVHRRRPPAAQEITLTMPAAPPSGANVEAPASDGDANGCGLGNAEEWLSAGTEALAAVNDTAAARPQTRIRLEYTKLDRARFIGNLELTALFYRAARRAQLPIAFSQGHHPLPRFAFGPALPVGVESLGEFLDIDLAAPLAAADVRAALAQQLPDGIEIVQATAVPLHGLSIAAAIKGFRYHIDATPLLDGRGSRWLQERIAAFTAAEAYPIRKHVKGVERPVNARPFVAHFALVEPALLDLVILFGASGTVKPMDLASAVLGIDVTAARGLRTRKVATLLDNQRLGPHAAAPLTL
jgi:radical SAM-linked protein